MGKGVRDQIDEAIESHRTLKLNYQGNPRHVIPLAIGLLKNGREAMLCYKILGTGDGEMNLAIRLYFLSKISEIEPTDIEMPINRGIDYYLTKHFKVIYKSV